MSKLPFGLLARRNPIRYATVISISGEWCSITFDGVKVLRGIGIVGNPDVISVGDRVLVEFIEDRAIVMVRGAGKGTSAISGSTVPIGDAGTAVTLSAQADAVMEIGAPQILDLDTQAANTFFRGPTSGVAAKPSFGVLVAADIPAIGEGPGIDIVGRTIGLGGDTILLYDSGGAALKEFAFTDAGLILALAATEAGDKCELPAGTLTGGPWTLAFGTLTGQTRDSTILDGQLTVGDAVTVDGLSIIRSENDAGAIYGVVEGAGDITAKLNNVYVKVENATGPAYAVYMASGGLIEAIEAELRAQTGSAGYAVYITSGDFVHWSGSAFGTVALEPYWEA